MRQSGRDHLRKTGDTASHENRRGTERLRTQLSVMYSGMRDGHMLIGNGFVCNVSRCGIGIRGNQGVKMGMELSLFIDIPCVDEPICIAQSRVSWIAGARFGVEMTAPKQEMQNELRLYVWNHLRRRSAKKG